MKIQEALDAIADEFAAVKLNFEKTANAIQDIVAVVTKTRDDVNELKERIRQLEYAEDERAYRRSEGIEP